MSWPWKVKVICQRKLHHRIRWPLDPQIINLSASNVTAKNVFVQNSGKCKAFAYVALLNSSKYFTLLNGPNPGYPVFKFGDNCPSSNWDTAQNVNVQGHDFESQGHSWRSTIFRKPFCTLPISIYKKFHWDPISSFSGKVEQIWAKICRKVARRKNSKRNNLTDVDTLWHKLCFEGVIWHKSASLIWRSFPELSFGISCILIHWAIMEIEPKTNLNCYRITRT